MIDHHRQYMKRRQRARWLLKATLATLAILAFLAQLGIMQAMDRQAAGSEQLSASSEAPEEAEQRADDNSYLLQP